VGLGIRDWESGVGKSELGNPWLGNRDWEIGVGNPGLEIRGWESEIEFGGFGYQTPTAIQNVSILSSFKCINFDYNVGFNKPQMQLNPPRPNFKW